LVSQSIVAIVWTSASRCSLGDLGVVLAALERAAVVLRGDRDDRGADQEELVGERGREVVDLDQAERQRAM
jgi:hypothetical protein